MYLSKKKRFRHLAPWFLTLLQATVIKTVWYQHKNKRIDQLNRTEDSEISPCIYSQLIYDKGSKNIQWGKDSLFNKWCWENWTATCKRMELFPCFISHTKINSNKSLDLNVRCETTKLLEENKGGKLLDISLGDYLFFGYDYKKRPSTFA